MNKKQKDKKNNTPAARKIIILIIILLMIVVAFYVVINLNIFDNTEKNTKQKIESIAQDYYENYYYDEFAKTIKSGASISEALEQYKETGFSKVTLRQLLSFDSGRHKDLRNELERYCDIDLTNIRITPESPYNKTNYSIEYNYSCNF